MEEKTVVVVGHIDHGKSTLLGRLLYDTDNISNAKIQEAQDKNGVINFAHLLDVFLEEQEEGKTINAIRIAMNIEKEQYIFFDVPGHKEFIDRMVTSASRVQYAIVVVDINQGMQEQTLSHLAILALFGVRDVIVVINKMDSADCNYEKFDSTKKEITHACKELNIRVKAVVPISAQNGWNVVKNKKKCTWYRGPSVVQLLQKIKHIDNQKNKNMCIAVQDTYEFNSKRYVVAKIIASNDCKSKLPHIFYDVINNHKYIVDSAKDASSSIISEVDFGAVISLQLQNDACISRGDILVQNEQGISHEKNIDANILWVSDDKYDNTKQYTMNISTQQTTCNILKTQQEKINSVKGEIFKGTIISDKDIIWANMTDIPALSIVTLSKDENVVAIGTIDSI